MIPHRIELKIDIGGQIHFVQDHCIHSGEDPGIFVRFIVSFRQVDLGAFVNAATAVAVMAYAAAQLHLHPTPAQMTGFVLLSLAGIAIHYSLMFLLASISFWTVRAQGIVWGYYNLFQIARMPDEAFRGVFKAVFTFAIPMLLVYRYWSLVPMMRCAVPMGSEMIVSGFAIAEPPCSSATPMTRIFDPLMPMVFPTVPPFGKSCLATW